MESLWTKTVEMPRFAPLHGDRKTQVLIVGGGMAGLLCAHRLHRAGVDCMLVEAKRIGSGVTKNTTAKISSQHGLIYHKLLRCYGVEKARLYWEANEKALAEYRLLCREHPCDFEEKDSFVYARRDLRKIEKELEALQKLGIDGEFCSSLPLPFAVAGAVSFRKQAQFHPLKFAAGIAEGLPIFEQTKVRELAPGKAITEGGSITADQIIVATHFPMLNKHGGYFLKLYQHRSYVLALKGAADVQGMYVDESEKGLSFRNYGENLLLGGGDHRTGKQGGGWRELEDFSRWYYPEAHVEACWATQDCMSLDGIPYIGQYAAGISDLYVASGFNKWGMSSSMVAAMVLSDLVQGKENPYVEVFAPERRSLHPQLALNIAESTLGLLTPTRPRCPHMGCALKYNAEEHSWDCPCHGSRFDNKGQLLDNPATDDKRM